MASRKSAGERGQMLVLTALMLTVTLGFSAIAIDAGNWIQARTDAQADVDAMALAGAQELCQTAACATTAEEVAAEFKSPNGLTGADDVEYDVAEDCSGNPILNYSKITVRATTDRTSLLAFFFGKDSAQIGACATAGRFAFGGSNGIRPFALEDDCILDLSYAEDVTIKYDSSSTRNCDSDTGNYAAVAIDGTGASIYRTTIKFGSDGMVCTDSTPGCCATMTSGCLGVYRIDTEPGNMIGPTRDGIDYLIANTPTNCDTWEEVTTSDGDIESACVPWAEGYTGATRIIIIPVVDGLWDSGGRHTVTIKNFAVLFLDGYGDKCSGNDCDVVARFIKYTGTLPNAILNPAGTLTNITIVTLVE